MRSYETVEIKDFSLFLLLDEGSGSLKIMTDPDSGGPKLTDPEHCLDQEQGWSEVLYMYFVFFADKMSVGGAHTGALSAPPPDVQSQLENLLFKVHKLSLLSRGFYITLFKQKHLNFFIFVSWVD